MSEAASLLALEEGGPFDFGGLREERVQRCLDEMGRRGVDVLLLGRDANVRFVSGARRLWYAGSRPFAPSCVVVRDSAEVHLMSIHEDGIPEAIPRDHVYGFAWSPKVFVRNI
ncbi:MAG: aminopeptidase P family N-terminal domain-containing protein, partial [Myxococcales bacterium]|nr:aminopeptidase P family N-terminal domain-containing protein [Myxococcales bacterium]